MDGWQVTLLLGPVATMPKPSPQVDAHPLIQFVGTIGSAFDPNRRDEYGVAVNVSTTRPVELWNERQDDDGWGDDNTPGQHFPTRPYTGLGLWDAPRKPNDDEAQPAAARHPPGHPDRPAGAPGPRAGR
ncbi:hypothetical protein [Kitasatospora herbaricolor]|uniref:hypothetical protein n=1 Tax=Kitasatospora herbaricolor TaxID=68217 RepID=UPI0036DD7CD7